MRVFRSMIITFATYSRIPMPQVDCGEENRKYVMCFFPLIGLVVGILLTLWLFLCRKLQMGGMLQGCVAALLPLLVTGGIHMDGFMDTSDAMASWQPMERRLEILKDSHAGAFSVIACVSYLLLSAGLFSVAEPQQGAALALSYVLSRTLSAWTLTNFKSARPGGMLDSFAKTARKRIVGISAAVYTILCAALWIALEGAWGVAPILTAGLCILWYRKKAYHYFGGVTGDLAGWFVQITELALAAVIILGGKIG